MGQASGGVASRAASGLVTPEYLRWATGNDVITGLTGDLEHIRLADYDSSDAILVYPGTANILGKMANGIDDTPMSTILATALGAGLPIIVSLAMHESMYENPAVQNNIRFLKDTVQFIEPHVTEGKAKLAEPEEVLRHVLKRVSGTGSSRLCKKRVLVTAGATAEPLDPIRAITNTSTGDTGMLLAAELANAGADVRVVYGHGRAEPAAGARVMRAYTASEMDRAVKREAGRCDIVVMAAAVSDYTPKVTQATKMKSDRDEITLRLVRTAKTLDCIKKENPGVFLVGFKAETDVSRDELAKRARRRLAESGADLIVANDIGRRYRRKPSGNRITLVDKDRTRHLRWKSKPEIARAIREEIESRI